MSLFSSSNKGNKEISIIFHIGSGSIGGYLIRLAKSSKPEILYASKVPISFQKDLSLDRYFTLMIKAFDQVALDIHKNGISHLNFTGFLNDGIKRAFYILSSPWCVSQTKIIKIKKNKPFEISDDSMNEIVKEQEAQFLLSDSATDSVLIEKKIIGAKLNGYKLSDVYNRKSKDVELAFFMTSSPKSVIKELKAATLKYFNFQSSYFNSFALSSFSAIRDIYPDKENFVYLDVHGELTDLSIVKDGILVESVSFPIGKSYFIRKLSKDLRISSEVEAYTLMNLYASGGCDEETSKKVKLSIDASLKYWSDNFHSTLTSLSSSMYLPRTIFTIAGDEFSIFFVKNLRKEKFSQFSLAEAPFDVIVLDSKRLSEHVRFDKVLIKGPFVELECVFLNKLFNAK
ncbi:MAG: hypothetical protein AAB688_02380 [Patescibacteria group bacterium]